MKPPQLIPGLLRSDFHDRTWNLPWQVEFLKQFARYEDCESAVQYYFFSLCVELNMDSCAVPWLGAWSSYLFHLQSALRECVSRSQSSWLVACAWVYLHLGMHEEAVELALQYDVILARKFADMSEIPLDLKRHMWLGVVKHIIGDRSLAISESANVLKERPVLSIEDILPVFPDFVVIDTFKSEISGCLNVYNHSLASLRTDITASTGVLSSLHFETLVLNTREISLPGTSCCTLSGYPVITGPFFFCFKWLRLPPQLGSKYTSSSRYTGSTRGTQKNGYQPQRVHLGISKLHSHWT